MSETIDYNKLVSIIFKQINIYRQNPRILIPVLQKRLKKYDQKNFMPTGDPSLVLSTEEGAKAVQQLIDTLKHQTRYPKFAWSYELHKAANHKANQLATVSRGRSIEVTQDIEELVGNFADWNGSLSELMVFGLCDPEEIICDLLIDDGNMDRDNRKQFFNPNLHDLGIGISTHAKYQFVVVFVLATSAEKKDVHQRKFHTNRNTLPQQVDNQNGNQAPQCKGCQTF